MTHVEEFLQLVKENPGLPIIPMVNDEICGEISGTYWAGSFGRSEVEEIYYGRDNWHIKSVDD